MMMTAKDDGNIEDGVHGCDRCVNDDEQKRSSESLDWSRTLLWHVLCFILEVRPFPFKMLQDCVFVTECMCREIPLGKFLF